MAPANATSPPSSSISGGHGEGILQAFAFPTTPSFPVQLGSPSLVSLLPPNDQPCGARLETLPNELLQRICGSLKLLLDQISFAQALIPAAGRARAMVVLTEEVTDKFFLHPKVMKHLFGPQGIKGHNGVNPTTIKPTSAEPYNQNGSIKDYKALIRTARQQRNRMAEDQLRKTHDRLLVRYRRSAVRKTRRMREGLKPSIFYKHRLGLWDPKEDRTYRQLKVDVLSDARMYTVVCNAEIEEIEQELKNGRNFEIMETLCQTLTTNHHDFFSTCRGCLKSGLHGIDVHDPALPFCESCYAIYCDQSMIESSFLDVLRPCHTDVFQDILNCKSLWFKPTMATKDGHTKHYVIHEEAHILLSMFSSTNANAMEPDNHKSISNGRILQTIHRHRFCSILAAMSEAAAQYLRHDRGFVNSDWIEKHQPMDLTHFGLPQWFMSSAATRFDFEIESMEFAETLVAFFAGWYDADPHLVRHNEISWRQQAVVAFWRKHTEQKPDDEDWKDLYNDLAIMPLPLCAQWADSGSSLHYTAHHIDKATAYCNVIHGRAPSGVLKAPEADRIQALSKVKDFAVFSEEVLKFAPRSVVKITLDLFVFAIGTSDVCGFLIKIMADWWNNFAAEVPIDRDNEHWATHTAARFWVGIGNGYFTFPSGRVNFETALHMKGVSPDRPFKDKLPRLDDGTPAALLPFLSNLVVQGLLVWQ